MEFIMTYGWAILVILVIIGVLVYFGVISPERLLPERCSFPSDLSCVGKPRVDFNSDTITLALINNIGYPITLTQAVSSDVGGSCQSPVVFSINGNAPNVSVSNGEQATVIINCTDFSEGRFATDITFNYVHSQNGITYPIEGEIRANAK
jgi:hypothetical protein